MRSKNILTVTLTSLTTLSIYLIYACILCDVLCTKCTVCITDQFSNNHDDTASKRARRYGRMWCTCDAEIDLMNDLIQVQAILK